MKQFIVTLGLFFICTLGVMAQVKISGKIVDAQTDKALEFVNVALYLNDSTYLSGRMTDDSGVFEFENVAFGNYNICATFLGYNETKTQRYFIDKNTNIGDIQLHPKEVELNEVAITASQVVYKADRQIIVPNANQIKASNNGLKLLENLQLPRIEIDPMTKAVKMMNEKEVQLRINGVLVTKDEILSLNPADIIRIEYHDDPGMRYGEVGAVIDFVTRVRESGGSLMLNLGEGITGIDFAEDVFAAKVNHKKSEFGINAYWHRRDIKWTRENIETYNFPNSQLIRSEKGKETRFRENNLNLSLNYTLYDTDKYLFNARFRNRNDDTPHSFDDRNSIITSSDGSEPLEVVNHSTWKSNAPSLDLYFQKNLKKDQLLILNVVGTYIDSKSSRLYTEQKKDEILTDIYSNIEGKKYSLIAEGIYEKNIKNNKISAGVRHTQSYTNNIYKGNIASDVSMNTAETYAFAEFQSKVNKFNYSLGLGMMRTYNSQAGKSNQKYIFRPKIKLSYNINSNLFLRYSGYVSGYAPSLSDLNNVEQLMDSLQIQRGNPDLKTVTFYTNELTFGFNKGIFRGELQAVYSYDHKPIMDQVVFENNKFVHSKANQKGFHRISVYGSLNTKIWKDYVVLSVRPMFRRYISNGNNYSHTYSTWRIAADLMFNYKGWNLAVNAQSRWNNFWGETESRGERMSMIMVGYTAPKWALGIWTANPFSKSYYTDSRNRSELTPKYSKVYTDDLGAGKLFVLNFTLNLDFGRKYKAASKRLNNDDSDAGILK